MPTKAKYRRVWFRLLKDAGIPDEDRHWVQEALTRKASARDWTDADWETAIAALQRDTGLHNDQHAHVREDGGADKSDAPDAYHRDGWASAAQCLFIAALCRQIAWRKGDDAGPLAFLERSVLRGEAAALRREIVEAHYVGGYRGEALWKCLTSREAAHFVRALIKERARSPREAACQSQS